MPFLRNFFNKLLQRSLFLLHHSSFLSLFFLVSPFSLFAQFPGSRGGTISGTNFPQQSQDQDNPLDDTLSKAIYYFYADNYEEKILIGDSSMNNFHLYDPVRKQNYEQVHLGNLGSAARQIVYEPRFHKGFDAGFHNYDLYWIYPNEIRFYEQERAFSDIAFSTGATQQQTSFNARFSKNLSKQLNLAIDYQNIRNQGQYTNQNARDNALAFSAYYHTKNNKYRAFFSFISNTTEQKENGGVNTADSILFTKNILPVGRPVFTEEGQSRYYQRDIHLVSYYQLEKTIKTPNQTRDSLVVSEQPPVVNQNIPTIFGQNRRHICFSQNIKLFCRLGFNSSI